MSENSYNVVFEFNESTGGAYGVRTWTSYSNQEEAEALTKDRPHQTVIAQGVTEAEALNLTSLTPEICRLMCAIEGPFEGDPHASQERVKYSLINAQYAIAHDRLHIAQHSLTRIDARKYLALFLQLVQNPKTPKTASMSGIMMVCYNNFGQVI